MRELDVKIFNKMASGGVYEIGEGVQETTPALFFTHGASGRCVGAQSYK